MRRSLRSPWQLEGTHTSGCNLRNTWKFPHPWRLEFLKQHKRLLGAHGTLRGIPRHPPQLETNHEIPPSMRDEDFFSCSTSRAILSSLSKLERRLESLHATQGGPGSLSQLEMKAEARTTSRDPCFLPHLEMRAHSLLQLKRNAKFPSHLKRRPVSPVESRVEPADPASRKKDTECPLSSR